MAGYIGIQPVPQATQTRETFTATASQTTFNTLGYTPGFVDVFLNGVKLIRTTDYTDTNGSDIVLTTGATVSDTVEVISYSTYEVNSQNYTGDLSVDTDTLYVDSTNDRVGVGTTSPVSALEVTTSNQALGSTLSLTNGFNGTDWNTDDVIGTINFRTDDTSTSEPIRGSIKSIVENTSGATSPAYTALALSTASVNTLAERMRIDSSGNLLVGKTSADGTSVGIELRPDSIRASRTSNPVAFFNRRTSDGEIARFQKDGTTVGSIGSRAGVTSHFIADPRSGGSGITGVGTQIRSTDNTGALVDGTIDLGGSSNRFKDLYLSGGVYLGGTGSANKLDDYEEGAFTPTFENGTFTYNVQNGTYTKVGNLVTIACNVGWTSRSGSGAVNIIGLPFIPINSGNTYRGGGSLGTITGVNKPTNYQMTVGIDANLSKFFLRYFVDNGSWIGTNVGDLNASGEIQVTASYHAQ